jgi:hypothetical protein
VRSAVQLTLIGLTVLTALTQTARTAETNVPIVFPVITPFPQLTALATSNHLTLRGLAVPTPDTDLKPGDTLDALILFHEKSGKETQWLLHLEVVPTNESDQTNAMRPMVIHTSTGNKITFSNSPASVQLRTLGPFAAPDVKRKPRLRDEIERLTLNKGFLEIGLDDASAVVLRTRGLKPDYEKGLFSFRGSPFPEAEVARGRKLAEELHITETEQRALAGVGPALMSYFSIVQRTAGLEDIMFKILDLPSLWSIIKHGGVTASFRMLSKQIAPAPAADWGLPETLPLYHLPFVMELNGQPALNITLAVTSPDSPLLPCAGVVGLIAKRPDDEKRFLLLRVVSAKRAAR